MVRVVLVGSNNSYQQQQYTQQSPQPLASQPVTLNNTTNNSFQSYNSSNDKNKFNTAKGNKNKKKISKIDISNPTGFRVVQHIGLNSSSTSFDVSLLLNCLVIKINFNKLIFQNYCKD